MDYFKFGHGQETLVIIPGLSVRSVMSFKDAVVDAYQVLADDFTVYLFDRREELPEIYSVKEMADDTAEAIRSLGLEHVSLFGASQGGMIAMEIAIDHPELVDKMVLGSTSARLEDEQYQTIGKWIDMARAGEKTDLYLAFGETVYPEDVYEQSKCFLIQAAEAVTDEDLERFIILSEGMRGFNVTEDLSRMDCPVLVIGSSDDKVLGADASHKIADILKGSRCELYMYDGYGHVSYDTAPDYKERILNFLKAR